MTPGCMRARVEIGRPVSTLPAPASRALLLLPAPGPSGAVALLAERALHHPVAAELLLTFPAAAVVRVAVAVVALLAETALQHAVAAALLAAGCAAAVLRGGVAVVALLAERALDHAVAAARSCRHVLLQPSSRSAVAVVAAARRARPGRTPSPQDSAPAGRAAAVSEAVLPSSHCSPRARWTTPSPQSSGSALLLQPSLDRRLPSSHSSPDSRTPLPHLPPTGGAMVTVVALVVATGGREPAESVKSSPG